MADDMYSFAKKIKHAKHLKMIDYMSAGVQPKGSRGDYLQQKADERLAEYEEEQRRLEMERRKKKSPAI